jgi:hypothetical protein
VTTSLPVPSLVGGVSQQSIANRPSAKVSEAVNLVLDAVKGASKRPGSYHEGLLAASLSAESSWSTYRVSEEEAYLIQASGEGVKAWDLTGAELPVTAPGGGAATFSYLLGRTDNPLLDPEGDWSVSPNWTLAPTANPFGTLSLSPDTGPLPTGEPGDAALLTGEGSPIFRGSIQNVSPQTFSNAPVTFSVYTKAPTGSGTPRGNPQVGARTASLTDSPNVSWAWNSEGGLDVVSVFLSSYIDDYGWIDAGNGWYRLWVTFSGLSDLWGGSTTNLRFSCGVISGAAEAQALQFWGAKITYGSALDEYFTSSNIDLLPVGDFAFLLNKDVEVSLDSSSTTEPAFHEALVFIRQGAFKTKYTLTINDPILGNFTSTAETWDGVVAVGSEIFFVDTESIAQELLDNIDPAWLAGGAGASATRNGSVLYIRSATLTPAVYEANTWTKFEVKDSQGDSLTSGAYERVSEITELPLFAPVGMKLLVDGQPETGEDDTWVEFKAKADGASPGDFTEGYWEESVAPGIPFALDAATMPHQLTRKVASNGQVSFEFGPADWGDRTVGDEETNEVPSFVSTDTQARTIAHLFFHQDRLGVLSGNDVVFSESGRPLNFWRSTVQTVPPSDRIDVEVASTEFVNLRSSAEFQGNLILFSDSTHYLLESEGGLSPTTINLPKLGKYEVFPDVAAAQTDRSLLVPFRDGAYAGYREILQIGDDQQIIAPSVTREIPNYIAGKVVQSEISNNQDLMVVRTERVFDYTGPDLWVYNFIWQGQEKLQSAWSRWRLDAGADVKHVAWVGDELYMVVVRFGLQTHLERLDFDAFLNDEGTTEWRLDQRIRLSDLNVTLEDLNGNGIANTSVIEMPFEVSAAEDWRLVYTDPSTAPGAPGYVPSASAPGIVTTSEGLAPVGRGGAAGAGSVVSGLLGVGAGTTMSPMIVPGADYTKVASSTGDGWVNFQEFAEFTSESLLYVKNYFKCARATSYIEAAGQFGFLYNGFVDEDKTFLSYSASGMPIATGSFPFLLGGVQPIRATHLMFRDLYTPGASPRHQDYTDGRSETEKQYKAIYPTGEYVIEYTGTGDIMVQGFTDNLAIADVEQLNTKVNPLDPGGPAVMDDVSPGRKEFRVNRAVPGGFAVSFLNVDPLDPIEITGFFTKDQEAYVASGGEWNQGLLSDLQSRYRVSGIRIMESQRINTTTISEPAELPMKSDAFWSGEGGVPLDAMVDLANLAGVGLWYCTPPFAGELLVKLMASTVFTGAGALTGVGIVEDANEKWLGSGYFLDSATGRYLLEGGLEPARALFEFTWDPQPFGDGTFSIPGPAAAAVSAGLSSDVTTAKFQATGLMAQRVWDWTDAVTVPAGKDYVKALGTQAANVFLVDQALPYCEPDRVAIAPYFFNFPFIDPTTGEINESSFTDAITKDVEDAKAWVTNHYTNLQEYNAANGTNIRLIAYEGGLQIAFTTKPAGYPTWYLDDSLSSALNNLWFSGFYPAPFPNPDIAAVENIPIWLKIAEIFRYQVIGDFYADFLAHWDLTTGGEPFAHYSYISKIWWNNGMFGLTYTPGGQLFQDGTDIPIWPKGAAFAAWVSGDGPEPPTPRPPIVVPGPQNPKDGSDIPKFAPFPGPPPPDVDDPIVDGEDGSDVPKLPPFDDPEEPEPPSGPGVDGGTFNPNSGSDITKGNGQSPPSAAVPAGTELQLTYHSPTELKIQGDITQLGEFLQVGRFYRGALVPSPPVYRRQVEQGAAPVPVLLGRTKVRRFKVAFEKTNTFGIGVQPERRKLYTDSFEAGATGQSLVLATGDKEFSALGESERLYLVLVNDSAAPSSWTAAEWLIEHSRRGRVGR